jgi:hypothetical protein
MDVNTFEQFGKWANINGYNNQIHHQGSIYTKGIYYSYQRAFQYILSKKHDRI